MCPPLKLIRVQRIGGFRERVRPQGTIAVVDDEKAKRTEGEEVLQNRAQH